MKHNRKKSRLDGKPTDNHKTISMSSRERPTQVRKRVAHLRQLSAARCYVCKCTLFGQTSTGYYLIYYKTTTTTLDHHRQQPNTDISTTREICTKNSVRHAPQSRPAGTPWNTSIRILLWCFLYAYMILEYNLGYCVSIFSRKVDRFDWFRVVTSSSVRPASVLQCCLGAPTMQTVHSKIYRYFEVFALI